MSESTQRASKMMVGLVVLSTLVLVGLLVQLAPSVSAAVDEPFAGRYRYYGMAVAPEDSSRIWLVGTYGQVRSTTDGGAHWNSGWSGVGQHLQDIVALDGNTLVAVGNDNVILRSEDAGHSWHRVADVPISSVENKLLRIRRAPNGDLWAVGAMGAALVSRDEGRSFEQIAPLEDIAWNDVGFSADGIWLVGEFGRIQFTQDGRQWRSIDSTVADSLMAIDFRGPRGVITGLNGTVLVTGDGGEAWSRAPIERALALYTVTLAGAKTAVLGGAEGHLLELGTSVRPLRAADGLLARHDVVLEVEWRDRQLMALTQTRFHTTLLYEPASASSERTDLLARGALSNAGQL